MKLAVAQGPAGTRRKHWIKSPRIVIVHFTDVSLRYSWSSSSLSLLSLLDKQANESKSQFQMVECGERWVACALGFPEKMEESLVAMR